MHQDTEITPSEEIAGAPMRKQCSEMAGKVAAPSEPTYGPLVDPIHGGVRLRTPGRAAQVKAANENRLRLALSYLAVRSRGATEAEAIEHARHGYAGKKRKSLIQHAINSAAILPHMYKVLELRKAGFSDAEIARTLEYLTFREIGETVGVDADTLMFFKYGHSFRKGRRLSKRKRLEIINKIESAGFCIDIFLPRNT